VDAALAQLVDQVLSARSQRGVLDIRGSGSKAFYGEAARGEALDVTALAGISSYEPTELVVSARCGTPLAELEAALAERGQCLPFEPPHFGVGATVGGMIAAGLSGPARASAGAVRDYVLGATLLSGRGEVLSFGGQVIKNVAGYDVSRMLAGSLGMLGVICEVSLKVVPVARASATLRFDLAQAAAITQLNTWAGKPLPINASAWWEGTLVLRLRGAVAAVDAAVAALGGDRIADEHAAAFWHGLREQTDEYFVAAQRAIEADAEARLWRLSLPQTAPPIALAGDQLIEWGGAQRWLVSSAPAAAVREAAARAGGHATVFRGDKSVGVFTPLTPTLARIQQQLKHAFDPDAIFNPGRLYSGH
jgi:glycolate oxidase FAD binding subunit